MTYLPTQAKLIRISQTFQFLDRFAGHRLLSSSERSKDLGHNHDLVSRKIKLLNCFAEDSLGFLEGVEEFNRSAQEEQVEGDFTDTVRVHISCIKRVYAEIICQFDML